jgi:homogentisate 1,2-dioxygenase
LPLPDAPTDFVDGLRRLVVCGDADAQTGLAALAYTANRSMACRALVNADGEMLLVPQQGRLDITTELGVLQVRPGEIPLLPRGLVFKVELPDGPSRGYVCENYGAAFRLPELGPIGSNGLANPRDFVAPHAAYESDAGSYELIKKFGGRLWRNTQPGTPFNVVAWHGNLVPMKYDTANFMTLGSISLDHPDPSIFTVLTSPSDTPGVANCDFVIFPPRWMVAEDTFLPPWYLRNLMSEFMGLVLGEYDAKPEGFKPGGASLHNGMVPHGPDSEAFEKASNAELKPHKLDNTLAFMFESRYRFVPTEFALRGGALDAGAPAAGRRCRTGSSPERRAGAAPRACAGPRRSEPRPQPPYPARQAVGRGLVDDAVVGVAHVGLLMSEQLYKITGILLAPTTSELLDGYPAYRTARSG